MTELNLSTDQLDRYSRHIIMDEVGPEGQQTLLHSSVLVVGAGGLGSPILQYLGAAGVGDITIVDDDTVERSNLQRQIIHGVSDIGRAKVDSAAEYLAELNPDVTVTTRQTRLNQANVTDLTHGHDVVVDASDNFTTRYLINDACMLAGIPYVHGAVYQFEGQAATFTSDGPCYRCLFPEAPPEGAVPDCATAGVLGIVPGTIGCIQATEVIKLLLDHGNSLNGRMIYYDAEEMSFDPIEIKQNPECPVCSDTPTITSVDEATYSERCRLSD